MSIGAYLNEVNRLKGLGHTIEEAQRIACSGIVGAIIGKAPEARYYSKKDEQYMYEYGTAADIAKYERTGKLPNVPWD
jgi:hypothetical protein